MQKRYFHQRKTLKSMFILRSLIIYVMHINNNNAEEACNEVTSCIYYIRAHAKLLLYKIAVWSCWVFVHFMSTEQLYPRGPIGVSDTHNSIVNFFIERKNEMINTVLIHLNNIWWLKKWSLCVKSWSFWSSVGNILSRARICHIDITF